MHDFAPKPEQNSITTLSIAANLLFDQAAALPGGGNIQSAATTAGAVEALHLFVPYNEQQVDISSISRDGYAASRTVRRFDRVVLERTTAGIDVSYRVFADPTYQKPKAWEKEYARWSSADSLPQKLEYGVVMAGRTESVRPLGDNQVDDLMDLLINGYPYNPEQYTLLSGSQGDRIIKNNVFAGLRKLLALSGRVASKWTER